MFISIATTSEAFVPRTAAIKEPFFPWPSLLERKVNKSLAYLFSSILSCLPMFSSSSTLSLACLS